MSTLFPKTNNVPTLDSANNNQHRLITQLIDVLTALSGEQKTSKLYEKIVDTTQEFTCADGATLYIVNESTNPPALDFVIVRNHSLKLQLGGHKKEKINFKPIPLVDADGQKNHTHVSAWVYHHKKPVNIDNVYKNNDFDFSEVKKFDKQTNYKTQSLLTLPLVDHANEVVGVLQLVNAKDKNKQPIAFNQTAEQLALALASSAAVIINTQRLIQSHKDLLDAFVKAIAKAIDAKSSHTSAHCQRVPELTMLLAKAACDASTGPLKDFQLDDDGWYELNVAAWLHDCGKLATPDHILDKATKLHLLTDRIEGIQAKFAAHICQLKLNADKLNLSENQLKRLITKRKDDLAFLEQVNQGGEFMQPSDQQRVKAIANLTWVDANGVTQPLLTNEEANMLCIPRGTLSEEERQIINDHIKVTIEILEQLPFPKHLARVPEYAGGHHERVDGKGYPKGLRGDQMSWPAKMMAIADIFEALTATERPYKAPMRLSQALGILQNMALTGHIDPDLYQLFIQRKVWLYYGKKHLLPEQLDVSDASPYLLN